MLLLDCTITCVCVYVPTIFLDVPLLCLIVVLMYMCYYVLVFYNISRVFMYCNHRNIVLSSYNILSAFSSICSSGYIIKVIQHSMEEMKLCLSIVLVLIGLAAAGPLSESNIQTAFGEFLEEEV